MSEMKRTADEWAALYGHRIVDPDGWRLDDGVRLDSPITEIEYGWRSVMSTVDLRGSK